MHKFQIQIIKKKHDLKNIEIKKKLKTINPKN